MVSIDFHAAETGKQFAEFPPSVHSVVYSGGKGYEWIFCNQTYF